jgi:hypothetical protein
MYDKVYTRIPCDALVIEDWPNLSGPSINLPVNIPLQFKFIADKAGIVCWVVEEPLGAYLLIKPGPLQNAHNLEQWKKDWQDQKFPQRWFKKDLLKFGDKTRIDWEAGPSICKENSILFQTILEVARDLIDILPFDDNEKHVLFNAMVDICLLTIGSGADSGSWNDHDDFADVQNQCLALWSFAMNNVHSKSGIDWYKQDDNIFISNLKPFDDEGE